MTKQATDNELSYDGFYAEACLAVQRIELGTQSPLHSTSIITEIDSRTDGEEDRFVYLRARVGDNTFTSSIQFARTSSGFYYTKRGLGQRYAKVYRSGRNTKSKTFPERKDCSFNFEEIAIQAISELEHEVLAYERGIRERANSAASHKVIEYERGFYN